MIHKVCPIIADLRDRFRARFGSQVGWPTPADFATYRHAATFAGLSRATLGDQRFEHVFQATRAAAEYFAHGDYLVETIFDKHQKTGYKFCFRNKITAFRVNLCHAAAMQGRSISLSRLRS